jgi:hypothetical protein
MEPGHGFGVEPAPIRQALGRLGPVGMRERLPLRISPNRDPKGMTASQANRLDRLIIPQGRECA